MLSLSRLNACLVPQLYGSPAQFSSFLLPDVHASIRRRCIPTHCSQCPTLPSILSSSRDNAQTASPTRSKALPYPDIQTMLTTSTALSSFRGESGQLSDTKNKIADFSSNEKNAIIILARWASVTLTRTFYNAFLARDGTP